MAAKKLFYWILVVLWICLVVYLSTQNADDSSKVSEWFTAHIVSFLDYFGVTLPTGTIHSFLREAAHFIVHMILAFLMYTACAVSYPEEQKGNLLVTILFCFILAMIDETIQCKAPGRSVEFIDYLLNLVGVQSGAILGILLEKE